MNEEEAKKILQIMTGADGGCSYCTSQLMKSFVKEFGFKEIAINVFMKEFDGNLYEEEN